MAKHSEFHRREVAKAAEAAGLECEEVSLYGNRTFKLRRDGVELWTVGFLRNGQFHYARSRERVFVPDYRTHAYTSSPREIMDKWFYSELGLALPKE